MPRDFDERASAENGFAAYPADRPGWCEAIAAEERPVRSLRLPSRRARARALPESDDLLGWGVLLFTAPALVAGALLLGQAALHLL